MPLGLCTENSGSAFTSFTCIEGTCIEFFPIFQPDILTWLMSVTYYLTVEASSAAYEMDLSVMTIHHGFIYTPFLKRLRCAHVLALKAFQTRRVIKCHHGNSIRSGLY